MVSPNVNRVWQEAKTLSPEERRELLTLLGEPATLAPPRTKDDEAERLLLSRGVIARIPPAPAEADVARFNAWRPVRIDGEPLSQTILQERR